MKDERLRVVCIKPYSLFFPTLFPTKTLDLNPNKNMKKIISTIILCGAVLVMNAQNATSPNGKLSVATADNKLVISYDKQKVLELADIPFSKLDLANKVKTDYKMLEGSGAHLYQQPC